MTQAARRWGKLAALAAFLAAAAWALRALGGHVGGLSPERVRGFVLSFGPWAPVIYLAAYGQPIIPLPASLMTIAGGLAFGPAWGTAAALAGATLRACSEFGVARLLGREAVAKLLKGRVAALDQRIAAHGFQAVLLIRLIPSFPFDMLNYGLGFTRVRFLPYAAGTVLGMIPGAFTYVYLGYSLTDPRNLWKLGLAIAMIAGLLVAQQAWKRRRAAAPGRAS